MRSKMSWTVKISKQARTDLDHFRAYDRNTYLNCYRLTAAVSKDPFAGPGKPVRIEGLGGNVWCRRTSLTDRMIYELFGNSIIVASHRTHIE